MTTAPPARPLPGARPPLTRLAEHLRGRLLLPEPSAAGPVAVVRAEDADDVVAAVRFAARHGLEVAEPGTAPGDPLAGVLLVSTEALDECTVHPEGWARVGAGVRWQRLLDAAAGHGLAPLVGAATTAGVVRSTTGGGIGPVARTYGLAADRVRAFEVVTGDGVPRRVTPVEHPDLFWGLRGGRGALGVVTALEVDLLAVDELYAGTLWFAGADAAAVAHRWRDWCAGLPPQATTSLAFLPAPAAVAVRFAWVGDPGAGAGVLAPVRAAAEPLRDDVAVRPYTALGALDAAGAAPGPRELLAHLLLDRLPEAAVDVLLALGGPATAPPPLAVELRQLGGAVARLPERPSAVAHRDARFALDVLGAAGAPAPAERAAALIGALSPWSSGRALADVVAPAGPADATRVYDAATLRRLAGLAAHHDPHRILRGARGVRGSG
ncbi:FAD-binding oxidoreductase [Geodermatophilus sp. SYSU D00815]